MISWKTGASGAEYMILVPKYDANYASIQGLISIF